MRFERTLRREAAIEGAGIHTGERARLVCRPAAAGAGVAITRMDLPGKPRWILNKGHEAQAAAGGAARQAAAEAQGSARRTFLAGPEGSVETVEHFLAALWALGISNLEAELTGPELPILDGSALEYIRAFTAAGLEDQADAVRELRVRRPVFVSAERSAILALPYDGLKVTYTLDYPYPGLAAQTVSLELTPENFLESVAPARTFCAREEADRLRELGFGKGATTENTLVMTSDGPLNNRLRFGDECARHKILDLIGDLGLLGADVRAHIVAVRSGHALNHRFRAALVESAQEQAT